MDTRNPHSIIPADELFTKKPKSKKDVEENRRTRERFMPLTDDEATMLAGMTPEQRHDWLKTKLPTKERLARHLASEGLHDLAYNARQGHYDDFDEGGEDLPQLALLRDLKARGRYDLSWIVTSGEYDATKAESGAWASRQTGEIARILAALRLTPGGGVNDATEISDG